MRPSRRGPGLALADLAQALLGRELVWNSNLGRLGRDIRVQVTPRRGQTCCTPSTPA